MLFFEETEDSIFYREQAVFLFLYRFSDVLFTFALILICWFGCETWWVESLPPHRGGQVTPWCVAQHTNQPGQAHIPPGGGGRPRGRPGCQLPDGPARQPPSMKAEPALGWGFAPQGWRAQVWGSGWGQQDPRAPKGGRVAPTCPRAWLWVTPLGSSHASLDLGSAQQDPGDWGQRVLLVGTLGRCPQAQWVGPE